MRRAVLACLSVLAAAAPAVSAATPPPRASLEGLVCERASSPLNRVFAVTGVMRSVTGTQRMQMKFSLQRRGAGSDSFAGVHGGDLGRWLEPKPVTLGQRSTDVWRLKKLVANLSGPATYRLRVTFRWLGASDVILERMTLTSATCAEPQ